MTSRVLPLLPLLAACGAKTATSIDLASLVSDDAVGIVRQPADQFPVLLYARELAMTDGQLTPCWASLEHRISVGYQISLPRGSYFMLEGDLPKSELESCVANATHGLIKPDGAADVAAFATPDATVYAAWRGRYVIVGNREQVDRAIKVHAPDVLARWRTELAALPSTAPTWILRTDPAFDDLVGAPTSSFLLVIDKLEVPPKSFLAGRVIVRYKTAADATIGERFVKDWIARGKFPRTIQGPSEAVALYDQLAAALQRARLTRTDATLELAFDSTMFGGMWAQFAQAAASLGAAPP